MKLINKTLMILSFVGLSLSSLEAKSLEFFLDHKTQENYNLQANLKSQNQKEPIEHPPSFSPYCQQLTVENLGNQPIKNCFPYINQKPCTSLDTLASQMALEKHPLLALYQFWKQSLILDETVIEYPCHPLDLLNFKGVCSRETFRNQFVRLCNALGIKTRLANVQGKILYDFCLEDEWNLLDIDNDQIYLALDNETLISSEEIMDDPLLALRTKYGRQANKVDFKQAWLELACFDIINPTSALPVFLSSPEWINRPNGFDLYPKERLVFNMIESKSTLNSYECSIEHQIHLEERQVSFDWTYASPCPIKQLENHSSVSLFLIDQNADLSPGETFVFKEDIFTINVEFNQPPKGFLIASSTCSHILFPSIKEGQNLINLGPNENLSSIRLHYSVNEEFEHPLIPQIKTLNHQHIFDYCSPYFNLTPFSNMDIIWWQISSDEHFQLIPANFDQIELFTHTLTLSTVSETFLNPDQTYYFRVKGCVNGQWSEWSIPYAFSVNKPIAVEEVEFDQVSENCYELNWERRAEESNEPIEYLVFGSNSLDFIPSIYHDKQINTIINGETVEEDPNDNLITITTEPKVRVNGGLAYYRIIARQRGQLSVPSTLIRVYDQDLIQPRNVLQLVEEDHQFVAKRVLFSPSYPWSNISLPKITQETISSPSLYKNQIINIQSLLRSALSPEKYSYEYPDVEESIWESVRPYLLPPNHPAWPKLCRVFCKSRATLNPDTFKKAGFKRYRPGRWSRVSASSHPEFNEYFIKCYCDCELGILYDWKKWIHRIEGAEFIRQCIKDNNLQNSFKVPHKWIYPLPKNPSPPHSSRYLRKNFILVCENMRIQDHDKNEKMYKKEMNYYLLKGLYTILQTCGLYDSVYCFNCPFCKDGRIAIIDCEYHHKWPIPFNRLTKCFSKENQRYWQRVTYNGGEIPPGENRPNPPRMDRRDIPANK